MKCVNGKCKRLKESENTKKANTNSKKQSLNKWTSEVVRMKKQKGLSLKQAMIDCSNKRKSVLIK